MSENIIELYPLKVFTLYAKEGKIQLKLEGIVAHDIEEAKSSFLKLISQGKYESPDNISMDILQDIIAKADYDFVPLTKMELYPMIEENLAIMRGESGNE